MMSLSAMLVFAAALALACATPGPSTVALATHMLAHGLRSALPFGAGLLIGELVWLSSAALGVAALAERLHPLVLAIKYAGAAYLLWIAWKFWNAPVPASPSEPAPTGAGVNRLLLGGLSLSLGNPKTMLFYVALLPGLVGMHVLSVRDLLALTLVALTVVAAVLAAYALLAARIRRFTRSPHALRRVHRGSGVLMVGTACAIAMR
jgi:threonine/homoserine/homoserine lactone efflux protein